MVEILAFAGLLVGGLIATEIGSRLAAVFTPQDETYERQFDVVRSATFALVAFLIGFSFSGAAERFVDRLDVIVSEANALGTAWLRADVLPEPQRSELKATLKEYTADRVMMLQTRDRDEFERVMAKADGLQSRMWAQALAGTKDNAPMMLLVLPPLNEVIDLHMTHVSLSRRQLPQPILIVLLGSAALSLALVGFTHGRTGRRSPLLDGTYAAVLAVALWMTIDLDHPLQGLIQVSAQPIIDTLAAMK